MVVILEGVAMVIDKETEGVVLTILTQNESLLREVQKEQKAQATILDEVMSTTQSLMDDVNTIREKL